MLFPKIGSVCSPNLLFVCPAGQTSKILKWSAFASLDLHRYDHQHAQRDSSPRDAFRYRQSIAYKTVYDLSGSS